MRRRLSAYCAITLTTLLLVAGANRAVDCNNPSTWTTPSGVQSCAINGGK